MKFLIKSGGNPNIPEVSTITSYPLINSIINNSYEFVKCLLKAKADPNCDMSGKLLYGQNNETNADFYLSALHCAVN